VYSCRDDDIPAVSVRKEMRADFDIDGYDDDDAGMDEGGVGEAGGMMEEEEEAPRINVDIPRCVAQLGSELYFVKLPNFLSVETR
jgi:RNA polymerase-associated protein LEO1